MEATIHFQAKHSDQALLLAATIHLETTASATQEISNSGYFLY
jgi:hypothetical protein